MNELLILHKVSEGDWDAYADLFNHYLPKLSQYIYPFANQSKEDTEEVIQEVFLKIWEKRERASPRSAASTAICSAWRRIN